ncbi:uncharacterized protein K441DRAFT_367704 [Cenococcum geophilum 1.58]|uniref:uncharacterized protein n=1 Tax=Cenococcum geophilum 1.58 TaxID=794803 RepID=UPI00358F922E|nr:hypothetical protein K441DRAFT_367704 [Cenococcum geophilum 1.58]
MDDDYFYYEGQTSLLITGVDECLWTTLCLVDAWYGGEENLRGYLENCPEGEGFDPPHGGCRQMTDPFFNSREYFLAVMSRRITQATKEMTILIETFDERMVVYADKMNSVFEDDEKQTHTRRVDSIIRALQRFRNCLLAIINAWETFSATHMFYFDADENKRELWGGYKAKILDQIAKLISLKRNILDPKLDLYRGIHAGLGTASSLKESAAATRQAELAAEQARTAIRQGENIQILTRMAAFYLPLTFTAAFFSMSFIQFSHPWFMFLLFLIVSVVFNFLIASNSRLLGLFF